ncbi:hypothetical protein [Pseudomonas asiatica]|uniref:hypothetical protein n=1 Tax=Pseudomonas asiatica TaxID=2219225 RepID=UPI002AC8DE6E|nr:hypothetical protein [Pseudomonas asiatica]WPX86638.1 hypothetical protein PsasTeo6_06472 [Pseudomonas asiatica]
MEELAASRRHSALLWGVNLCAISASTLSYIYLSYYIYANTASLILSQVVLFAPMVLPVILVVPIYRLADYLAPRTLLWSSNLLSLGCAAVTYKILPHHVEVAVLGAVVIGALDALQRVGRIVAIKCYFPSAQIASSVPLTLTAQFIAGGLAGISLVLFKANMTPGLALLITVSLFSIAALAAYLLPAPTKPPITVQVAPKLLTALGSLLQEYPALRLSLYQFIVFVSLFQGFFNVSRVLLPAHVLGLGEAYVGLLQAVNSVAALVGAVLFYRLGKCNLRPLPMPMAVVSGLFMMLAAFGHDIQSSYIAYFFYIFFFELTFFKLQADLVRSTPASAMPLMASVQYAGVYLGMIVTIFVGSILVKYAGLFSTSVIFVAFYFVAINALRKTVATKGKQPV